MCLNPTRLHSDLLPGQFWQKVPCGKCPECLSKRAVDWAYRVGHQLSLSPDNAFITLTYDDKKLPDCNNSYVDFQLFMKKLRKYIQPKKVKYFCSIEYGGENGRLHFHSIIFGWYPRNDTKPPYGETVTELRKTPKGNMIYRSTELEKLWKNGYSSVAPATASAAYYIASYALSDNFYVSDDGEILSDKLRCSQGIGLEYFSNHYDQICNLAEFEERSLPRYYIKKLEQLYPVKYVEFLKHINHLRNSITDKGDSYARLMNHVSKHTDCSFRSPKDFENIEAQLNDFARSQLTRKKTHVS